MNDVCSKPRGTVSAAGGDAGCAAAARFAAVADAPADRANSWLLSAGAFVSLVVPLIVFLALQRYFVRGLLAGSVKG